MSEINLFADHSGRPSREEARDSTGMGSHQSAKSQTDTWFSPPAVLEALGGWESFDLDPASHADRPWPTARARSDGGEGAMIEPVSFFLGVIVGGGLLLAWLMS